MTRPAVAAGTRLRALHFVEMEDAGCLSSQCWIEFWTECTERRQRFLRMPSKPFAGNTLREPECTQEAMCGCLDAAGEDTAATVGIAKTVSHKSYLKSLMRVCRAVFGNSDPTEAA